MAKILVTGGCGFIGSSLVNRLLKEGNDVEVIDNLHTGRLTNINLKDSGVLFQSLDVKDIHTLADRRYDQIYHLGIYSASPMYRTDPALVGEVVSGMTAVLEFAREQQVPLVFASSSSLYNGHPCPQTEMMEPFVRDYYIEARYCCERLAELYDDLFALNVAAMRFFSVYGPNEASKGKYANLITQFIRGYRQGLPPTIYTDGTQSRDFTHVDDVVEAMILAMKKNAGFGPYNVGTGRTTDLNTIVRLITEHMEGDIPAPNYVPCPADYIMLDKTQADTKKSEERLGFKAKVSVEEGVARMLALEVV